MHGGADQEGQGGCRRIQVPAAVPRICDGSAAGVYGRAPPAPPNSGFGTCKRITILGRDIRPPSLIRLCRENFPEKSSSDYVIQ